MSKVADYYLLPPTEPPILIADDYECPHLNLNEEQVDDEVFYFCDDCGDEVEVADE